MFYYKFKNKENNVCSSSNKINNNQIIEITKEEYDNILQSLEKKPTKSQIELIEPNQPITIE